MNAASRRGPRVVSVLSTLFAVACASGQREAKAPRQEPQSTATADAEGKKQDDAAYAQPKQPGYPESTAPQQPGLPAQYPPSPPPSTAAPQGGAMPIAPGRNAAIARAGNDFDVAQRELDVAAGDCRNACRALGSMDRAAGRLCELAQASEETRRCDDARRKVLSARDRVKQTCGGCPGGPSVERNDPVPSTR